MKKPIFQREHKVSDFGRQKVSDFSRTPFVIPAVIGVLCALSLLPIRSALAAAWWQQPGQVPGAQQQAGAANAGAAQQRGAARSATVWWQQPISSASCVGSHWVKTCLVGKCTTTQCPTGSFCIAPKQIATTPDVVEKAQCLVPDAIGPASCADAKTQKLDLVIQGQTVAALDPCPTAQPQCVLGQCVTPGQAVCKDDDATNYGTLLAWSQAGKKSGLLADVSVTQPSAVVTGVVGSPQVTYHDKCKGPGLLLEQVCQGTVAQEIGIKCSDLHPGATCVLNGISQAYCAVDLQAIPDTDQDTVPNLFDNCPTFANTDQLDTDGNGLGDLCQLCDPDKDDDVSEAVPDAALRSLISEALGLSSAAKITPELALQLTILESIKSDLQPKSLGGLACFPNLQALRLGPMTPPGEISDLSPVKGLKQLHTIDIWYHQVSDLTPLVSLTALRKIGFIANQIANLEPLKNLANLRDARLPKNLITNLGGLNEVDPIV